jgi:hypothetical protein
MKKITLCILFFVPVILFGQISPYATHMEKSNEQFRNGEFVWKVINQDDFVGQFIPVKGINLVTKETDPELFSSSLASTHKDLAAVATSPDGMTSAAIGYPMEGKALATGRPCGDGKVYNYGLVIVRDGFNITFSHKKEIADFDSFYEAERKNSSTAFFLPVILRNGDMIDSRTSYAEKVFIRRDTPSGPQIGMIVFNDIYSYHRILEIVLGLDRQGKSRTTHIYILDGGPTWGQWSKEVNGKIEVEGTRDPDVVSNYLVFY